MDECGKVTSDLGEAIFVTGTALSYSLLATGKSQIALVIFFFSKRYTCTFEYIYFKGEMRN